MMGGKRDNAQTKATSMADQAGAVEGARGIAIGCLWKINCNVHNWYFQ